jgi:XTP/dITP diphosphohydrolase
VNRLLDTLRALRAPDGCPWDRVQTHESLRPHLIEEAAEAVDALGSGVDADVVEELGDVLLHVAFHAVIAEEDGRWSFADVERVLVEKLIRRHPHVFGDATADDPEAVEATWARIKAEERGDAAPHPVRRVPRSLPALARAAALARALEATDIDVDRGTGASEAAEDDPAALAEALWRLALRAARAGHDPETLLRDRVEAAARDALADGAS